MSNEEDIIAVLRKQRSPSPVRVKTDVDSENCNYLNDVACFILVGVFMLIVLLLSSHHSILSYQQLFVATNTLTTFTPSL